MTRLAPGSPFPRTLPGLLLAGAILACTALSAATADELSDRRRIDELVPRWERMMQDLRVPGMAVAVVRGDDVLLARGFGWRDVERRLPVDERTLFYIASSTKSYVAMAVQILAQEGKLELDDPVRRHLPRFEISDPEASRTITLRDLLSHARGLRSGLVTQAEAYTGLFDEELYYRLLGRVEPLDRFGYSNLHFTLLGRVIESVTGKPWQQVIGERILEPAGMTRTTTSATEMFSDPNVALPTLEVNGEWVPARVRKTDRTMHAAGGMAASAEDLARWLRINLAGGTIDETRLLSEARLREMHAPQAEVGSEFFVFGRESYGLGWYVGSYGGETLVHHFGSYVASRAHVSFLPGSSLGVAVVMNASDPVFFVADTVATDVYRSLGGVEAEDPLPEMTRRIEARRIRLAERAAGLGPNPAATADGLSLPAAAYAGTYHHPDLGALELTVADAGLACRWGALEPRLHTTGPDAFLLEWRPGAQAPARFELDREGGRATAIVATLAGGERRFEHAAPPG